MKMYDILLAKKLSGEGGGGKPTQTKTATPTEQEQSITPDEGYLLSEVTVNPIPSQYIVPTGKKTITANATDIDIAQYATADVAVPTANLGTKNITTNGTYAASADNLDGYSEVTVNTNPTKGFVFSDFDSDGKPHQVTTYGYTSLPSNQFKNYGNPSWGAIDQAIYASFGKMERFILNDGITSLGLNCFAGCKQMTSIDIPESVTSIGNQCFKDCSALESIVFPAASYTFGDQIVNGCTALTASEFRGNVNIINYGFFLRTSLTEVYFRGNVNRFLQVNQLKTFPDAQMKLFDFSHATFVPQLDNAYLINDSVAIDGCTIKVPQALLAEWQEATNWVDVADNALVTWVGV